METKVVTAHVPLELAAKMDAIAERRDRSRGWIMKQALSAWVDQEEQRYRLTLDGLTDVDAGRTVDHDDVETWVNSLESGQPLPIPT
jgi:predicted transcriptional regulator